MACRSWICDLVLDGVVAVFVGGAVDDAAFDAAAGEPDREAVRVVIAAGRVPWATGVRPNSPRPDDERLSEQAARLQVFEQAGDRPVDGAGILLVALLEFVVLVPAVGRRDWRRSQLDETDAALDQSPRQQALACRRSAVASSSMP